MYLRNPSLLLMADGDAPAPGAAAPAAPAPSAPVATAAPVAEAAPAPVATPAPTTADAPAVPSAPETTGQDSGTGVKPATNEFAPSLLEAGAKPPAEAEAPKAEGDAPAPAQDAAPAEQAQAPTYEFQLPEGLDASQLDQDVLQKFTTAIGAHSLPAETAQELMNLHVGEMQRLQQVESQRQWDVFNEQQAGWREEVMGDPEVGGARFQTAMRTCATVIEQYGGTAEEQQAIMDVMKYTGAGNNPNIVRLIHRIGVALGREGAPVPANPTRTPAPDRAQRSLNRYKGS